MVPGDAKRTGLGSSETVPVSSKRSRDVPVRQAALHAAKRIRLDAETKVQVTRINDEPEFSDTVWRSEESGDSDVDGAGTSEEDSDWEEEAGHTLVPYPGKSSVRVLRIQRAQDPLRLVPVTLPAAAASATTGTSTPGTRGPRNQVGTAQTPPAAKSSGAHPVRRLDADARPAASETSDRARVFWTEPRESLHDMLRLYNVLASPNQEPERRAVVLEALALEARQAAPCTQSHFAESCLSALWDYGATYIRSLETRASVSSALGRPTWSPDTSLLTGGVAVSHPSATRDAHLLPVLAEARETVRHTATQWFRGVASHGVPVHVYGSMVRGVWLHRWIKSTGAARRQAGPRFAKCFRGVRCLLDPAARRGDPVQQVFPGTRCGAGDLTAKDPREPRSPALCVMDQLLASRPRDAVSWLSYLDLCDLHCLASASWTWCMYLDSGAWRGRSVQVLGKGRLSRVVRSLLIGPWPSVRGLSLSLYGQLHRHYQGRPEWFGDQKALCHRRPSFPGLRALALDDLSLLDDLASLPRWPADDLFGCLARPYRLWTSTAQDVQDVQDDARVVRKGTESGGTRRHPGLRVSQNQGSDTAAKPWQANRPAVGDANHDLEERDERKDHDHHGAHNARKDHEAHDNHDTHDTHDTHNDREDHAHDTHRDHGDHGDPDAPGPGLLGLSLSCNPCVRTVRAIVSGDAAERKAVRPVQGPTEYTRSRNLAVPRAQAHEGPADRLPYVLPILYLDTRLCTLSTMPDVLRPVTWSLGENCKAQTRRLIVEWLLWDAGAHVFGASLVQTARTWQLQRQCEVPALSVQWLAVRVPLPVPLPVPAAPTKPVAVVSEALSNLGVWATHARHISSLRGFCVVLVDAPDIVWPRAQLAKLAQCLLPWPDCRIWVTWASRWPAFRETGPHWWAMDCTAKDLGSMAAVLASRSPGLVVDS